MTTPNNSQLFFCIASMSTQKKSVRVDCYAGSKADEYPLRFYHEEGLVEISRIIKRWQTPDSRCFKILGADGCYYTLEYDQPADQWKILTGTKQFGSK
jgi:hypothetical protein